MDFKKIAKFLKNSDLDEDDLEYALQKIYEQDELFDKYATTKGKIDVAEFKEKRKAYKKKLKENSNVLLQEKKEDNEEIFDEYELFLETMKRNMTNERRMMNLRIEQDRIAREMRDLENEMRDENLDELLIHKGVNNVNHLKYFTIMTKENFKHAKYPKNTKPKEIDAHNALKKALREIRLERLPDDKKFFVSFIGPDGQKTFKSGIDKEGFKKVIDEFDPENDGFFEEYNFSRIYGVTVAYI